MAAESDAADGQVYNLGGDEPISLHDLGDRLLELYPGGEYITKSFPDERKRIDIGDYYSDYQKIRTELGWTPVISLQEGLQRTLDYYQKNLVHYL